MGFGTDWKPLWCSERQPPRGIENPSLKLTTLGTPPCPVAL